MSRARLEEALRETPSTSVTMEVIKLYYPTYEEFFQFCVKYNLKLEKSFDNSTVRVSRR